MIRKYMNKSGYFKYVMFVLLLSVSSLCTSSLAFSQEDNEDKILDKTFLTLDFKDANAKEVFKEVRKQAGLYVFYKTEHIDLLGKITIKVDKKSVRTVLNRILENTNLEYLFSDGAVSLRKEQKLEKKSISGVVYDKLGNPLPGASVAIKGINKGTTTDINGEYLLRIPAQEVTLMVSFIGMKTQHIFVPVEKVAVNFYLKQKVQEVEEVVVTGFERIDKRQLTGSVQTLKADEILEPTGLSIDKMLQGKVAGMQVLNSSSTPGTAPKIRIRGSSSILGNREPIWVVDGVIMTDPVNISNADLNSLDNINLIGNAISFLNPSDIERIDVLSDVSATAIYGVKAANGVIVITTKSGKEGKMRVNYSTSLSIKQAPTYNDYSVMNSAQRVAVSEEIVNRGLTYTSDGVTPNVGYELLLQRLYNKQISYDEFNNSVDYLRGVNTDWLRELMNNSFSHTHNISLSGGNAKTTYYTSVSFADDKGMQLNTGTKRYTANLKVNSKLSSKLSLGFGINTSYANTERTHNSVDLTIYSRYISRALPLYNADGSLHYYPKATSFVEGTDYVYYNILNELGNTGADQKMNIVNTRFNVDYKINDKLSFKGDFSYNTSETTIEEWANEQSYYITGARQIPYGYNIPDDHKSSIVNPFGGELLSNKVSSSNLSARASLNYNIRFDENYFDIQVGSAVTSLEYKGMEQKLLGYYPDRGMQFISNVPQEYTAFYRELNNTMPRITNTTTNTMSFYGILRYSLKNKYVFNFNIRADGSNKFGQDKATRFLPVWSVSGRWNIGDESFVRDNLSFVDNLSLKASFGYQGNVSDDQTPNMIAQMGTFDALSQQFSSTLFKYPNPNLTWEKTESYQIGADFSLFNNFMSGGFAYYYKKGEDQIVDRKVSPTNGSTSFKLNSGTVLNKGWDLTLGFNFIKKRDFSWNLSINTSYNKNTVTDSGNPLVVDYSDYVSGSLIKDGTSINSFYSYKFSGLDNSGLPTFAGIDIVDSEGNVTVDSKEEALMMAFVYSGKREPVFVSGLNTNVRYKSFTLSAGFTLSLGNKLRLFNLYDNTNNILPLSDQSMPVAFINRWQKPGDQVYTNIPVLSDQDLSMVPSEDNGQVWQIAQSKWEMYNYGNHRIASGNYLKCNSLSLAYSFPENICQKLFVESLSCSFTGNNLFFIADSKLDGQNPEQLGGQRALPSMPTYSLSINVSF